MQQSIEMLFAIIYCVDLLLRGEKEREWERKKEREPSIDRGREREID